MSTQIEQQIPFRFHVGLRVSAERTEPDSITAMLGLQPHRVSKKGEVPEEIKHLPRQARGVYERHHKWAASFEPLTLSEPLDSCLTRIANHLDNYSDSLAELSKDGEITLYIYAYPDRSLQEPVNWAILEGIRSGHPVGLEVNVYSRHETDRPVDASRPKNHS